MKTKYSEILRQKIIYDKETNSIITEDGVEYQESELQQLHNISDGLKRTIHKIKLSFKGEIIDAESL